MTHITITDLARKVRIARLSQLEWERTSLWSHRQQALRDAKVVDDVVERLLDAQKSLDLT